MKVSLMNMLKQFDCWIETIRQRREIHEHGAAICKDIGVSKASLDVEAKLLIRKKNSKP